MHLLIWLSVVKSAINRKGGNFLLTLIITSAKVSCWMQQKRYLYSISCVFPSLPSHRGPSDERASLGQLIGLVPTVHLVITHGFRRHTVRPPLAGQGVLHLTVHQTLKREATPGSCMWMPWGLPQQMCRMLREKDEILSKTLWFFLKCYLDLHQRGGKCPTIPTPNIIKQPWFLEKSICMENTQPWKIHGQKMIQPSTVHQANNKQFRHGKQFPVLRVSTTLGDVKLLSLFCRPIYIYRVRDVTGIR